MKRIILFLIMPFSIIYSQDTVPKIYGHRGCRGLFPENSIIAFQKAIVLGADGIEFDVVVNKDKQLVISHEPYMESKYCLKPDGSEIKKEKYFNIYKMSQNEIEKFDCGTKNNSKFPEQEKIKTHKPLFQEFANSVNLMNKTLLFEIKSEKKEYNNSQPEPEEYVDIILKEVENYRFKNNIIFMCFDANIINELYKKAPHFRLIYLTYSPIKSIKNNLKDLEFTPFALATLHSTISKKEIQKAHDLGIRIFAWTVNKEKEVKKLSRFGIDGIITDYPNLFVKQAK